MASSPQIRGRSQSIPDRTTRRQRSRVGFLVRVKIRTADGERPLDMQDISLLPLAVDAGISLLPADIINSLPVRTKMDLRMAIANMLRQAVKQAGYEGPTVPPWEPEIKAAGRDIAHPRRRRFALKRISQQLRRRHATVLQRQAHRPESKRVKIDAVFSVYLEMKGKKSFKRPSVRHGKSAGAPRLAGIALRRIILDS